MTTDDEGFKRFRATTLRFSAIVHRVWTMARELPSPSTDLVGVLLLDGSEGGIFVGDRETFIAHQRSLTERERLGESSLAHVARPAGEMSPTLPNEACMWLIVVDEHISCGRIVLADAFSKQPLSKGGDA